MPEIKNIAVIRRNCLRIYGCEPEVAIELNGGVPLRQRRSAANRFTNQKYDAKRRGITWELTFPQWMRLWRSSGKFEMRGAAPGFYCMCRYGDVGPYSETNVYIGPFEVNRMEGFIKAVQAWKAIAAQKKFT